MLYPTNGTGRQIDGEQQVRYVAVFWKAPSQASAARSAKPYGSLGYLSMGLSITSTDNRLADGF
jgi:hypothetical protein